MASRSKALVTPPTVRWFKSEADTSSGDCYCTTCFTSAVFFEDPEVDFLVSVSTCFSPLDDFDSSLPAPVFMISDGLITVIGFFGLVAFLFDVDGVVDVLYAVGGSFCTPG